MGLDLETMKEIKRQQDAYMIAREELGNLYNDAIDRFDKEAKDCKDYVPATCHGEDDPECAHVNNENKWCEAGDCPLLR